MISQLSGTATRQQQTTPRALEENNNQAIAATHARMTEIAESSKITPASPPKIDAGFQYSAGELEKFMAAVQTSGRAQSAFELEQRAGAAVRELIGKTETQFPIPARALTDVEAERARVRFASAEPFLISDTGVTSFRDGDTQYNFYTDGRVTVHEAGVPTSQEEKEGWLSGLRDTLKEIEKHTGGLSLDELRANYEAASQRLNEIVDRAATTGTSGQIYDTVA